MKSIFFLFCFLLTFSLGSSQVVHPVNNIPIQRSNGLFIHGWNKADSAHISAVYSDTNWIPRYAGTRILVLNSVDTAEFFYTGSKWTKVGSGVEVLNLDTLRNAVMVTILNSAGQPAIIQSATTELSGVMSAGDKITLDRFVWNIPEQRYYVQTDTGLTALSYLTDLSVPTLQEVLDAGKITNKNNLIDIGNYEFGFESMGGHYKILFPSPAIARAELLGAINAEYKVYSSTTGVTLLATMYDGRLGLSTTNQDSVILSTGNQGVPFLKSVTSDNERALEMKSDSAWKFIGDYIKYGYNDSLFARVFADSLSIPYWGMVKRYVDNSYSSLGLQDVITNNNQLADGTEILAYGDINIQGVNSADDYTKIESQSWNTGIQASHSLESYIQARVADGSSVGLNATPGAARITFGTNSVLGRITHGGGTLRMQQFRFGDDVIVDVPTGFSVFPDKRPIEVNGRDTYMRYVNTFNKDTIMSDNDAIPSLGIVKQYISDSITFGNVINFSSIGNSGTSPNWSINSGQRVLNIPVASGNTIGTMSGSAQSFNGNKSFNDGIGIRTTAMNNVGLALGAGSTTVAPLHFNAGQLLSSPVNGRVEYDGSNLYITIDGTRRQLNNQDSEYEALLVDRSLKYTVDGTDTILGVRSDTAIYDASKLQGIGVTQMLPEDGQILAYSSSEDSLKYITPSGGGISDGDKGDITVSDGGDEWTINNGSVTDAKIVTLAWTKITGAPTTVAGYGITNAVTTSGNQTIAGNKTFSGYTTINNNTIRVTGGSGQVRIDDQSGGYETSIYRNSGNLVFNAQRPDFNFYNPLTLSLVAPNNSLVLHSTGRIGIGTNSPTAWVHTAPATSTTASLRIPAGVKPNNIELNDGDIYRTGTNTYIYSAGAKLDNITPSVTTLTANTSIDDLDLKGVRLIDASSGNITINLPTLYSPRFTFKKIDNTSNTVTLQVGSGGHTIEGNPTLVLSAQYDYVELVLHGTTWYIISQNN